jgi:hypothetical protein
VCREPSQTQQAVQQDNDTHIVAFCLFDRVLQW